MDWKPVYGYLIAVKYALLEINVPEKIWLFLTRHLSLLGALGMYLQLLNFLRNCEGDFEECWIELTVPAISSIHDS